MMMRINNYVNNLNKFYNGNIILSNELLYITKNK